MVFLNGLFDTKQDDLRVDFH